MDRLERLLWISAFAAMVAVVLVVVIGTPRGGPADPGALPFPGSGDAAHAARARSAAAEGDGGSATSASCPDCSADLEDGSASPANHAPTCVKYVRPARDGREEPTGAAAAPPSRDP